MHTVNTLTLKDAGFPPQLREIAKPPNQLYFVGAAPSEWLDMPKVVIVGSRKMSAYGRNVTYELAYKLAAMGVVVISGLAYGTDSVAHTAALEAGGITVAILATGVERIYPPAHNNLARRMVSTGGTLISEYANGTQIFKSNFIIRNRLVSGLADAVLITEAAINGGSLHTARFALDQGKIVMAVPGNINSPTSIGCNNLIKSGAIPVTEVDDILFALKINPAKKAQTRVFRGSPAEEAVFDLIKQGICSQEQLANLSQLDSPTVTSALTMLEIGGFVRPEGAGNWTIS